MNANTDVLYLVGAARRLLIASFVGMALLATAFAGDALQPGVASADASLELVGSCNPEAVRPGEPVLVSCTVTLTNTGDEAATNLSGSVFIADGCGIPSRFTFIDRTLNGDVMPPTGLSFDVPDLNPGETTTQISRVATENFVSGPTGGSVTITSAEKPSLSATLDLCWDVSEDAAAPGTALTVTKTTLNEPEVVVVEDPVAPPPPDNVVPLPIEPPPLPPSAAQADFEIVITNVSDTLMTGVSLLDAPTADAVFTSAQPAATGVDALGRPFWEVGDLAPGDEFSTTATYGPAAGGNCSFADDIAIVSATPVGGAREDYIAFSDFGVAVGPCEFIEPDFCWHYPPGGDSPVQAPCEEDICWATSPIGSETRPLFGCDESVDYCWFVPPGDGYTDLQACGNDVCWASFGEAPLDSYSSVPCSVQFCEYEAPDGSFSTRGECDFPVCWSQAPGGDGWQEVYGCGEFQGDLCWFAGPENSEPILESCQAEVCWLSFGPGDMLYNAPCDLEFCEYTAPDGLTTTTSDCAYPTCWSTPPGGDAWQQVYDCGEFQDWCWYTPPGDAEASTLSPCGEPLSFAVNVPLGGIVPFPAPWTLYDGLDWCWPIPPDSEEFITFPLPCEDIESIYWFVPADGGPAVPSYWTPETCLQPPPPDLISAPGFDLPPDLLIPGPCLDEEEPQPGVLGSSVPVEEVVGVSTPAEIVEGTIDAVEPRPSEIISPAELAPGNVTVLDPVFSDQIIPAEIVRTERTEPDPNGPDDVVILPIEEIDRPTAPPGPRDLVDADEKAAPPEIASLPDTGSAEVSRGSGASGPIAGIAAGGLIIAILGFGMRRRVGL